MEDVAQMLVYGTFGLKGKVLLPIHSHGCSRFYTGFAMIAIDIQPPDRLRRDLDQLKCDAKHSPFDTDGSDILWFAFEESIRGAMSIFDHPKTKSMVRYSLVKNLNGFVLSVDVEDKHRVDVMRHLKPLGIV